ncbi:MAG TPA: serine/threonine-protein kinase [Gemmataceae bacterium]|jgi:serine/threonine protein kinase|nr:serine/threonine-protein kinase [Gemmataceae bacterium]
MSEPARGPHEPPPVPTPAQQDQTAAWGGTATPSLNLSATLTASGSTLEPDAFGIPNPFGRYTVVRLLGRGGMGAVFLAQDAQLARPVALKIPMFRGTLSATQKERFLREARAVAALRHAHLCPVFDVGEERGMLFLTTAYIEGRTLSAVIERGPMAPEKAIDLVRKVALGMQAAHVHGTIHRDLKPANIMIDPSGEPVVMDFGLARRSDAGDDTTDDRPAQATADAGLTQLGSVLGTPAYMPPEQARGDVAAIGPRSDVYSLGVILFELLTGRRPFVGADTADTIRQIQEAPPPKLREFYPWIDAGLEAACLRAMAKLPEDRYWSMAEFADALKQVVEPELKVVLPPPLPPKPAAAQPAAQPKKKRRRWLIPIVTLSIIALSIALCVGIPAIIIYQFIAAATDKIKEVQQSQSAAAAEWGAIEAFWKPPAADAPADVLFPPTLPDNHRRVRADEPGPDPELGLTMPGRRATYTTADGAEVSVAAYQCSEDQARAIHGKIQTLIRQIQQGTADQGSRAKVVYSSSNTQNHTITFGFSDQQHQRTEFGKTWYSQGWLFYFRTDAPMVIEQFPSKYLLEMSKKALAPPRKTGPEPPQAPAASPKK